MSKIRTKKFGFVNVEISVSDEEIHLWACNRNGINVLRIKAVGKVHCTKELNDIIVTRKLRPNYSMKRKS